MSPLVVFPLNALLASCLPPTKLLGEETVGSIMLRDQFLATRGAPTKSFLEESVTGMVQRDKCAATRAAPTNPFGEDSVTSKVQRGKNAATRSAPRTMTKTGRTVYHTLQRLKQDKTAARRKGLCRVGMEPR
jgi:hypothetical protein